ncbi:MAG: protein phosphatase 2C domain-containing protein [Gemmatimonadota bacterium]|nr:protein phosphatase 2C domain-containing protein [Gemmatimonadota bacterium]
MSTEGFGASAASRDRGTNEDAYLVHDGFGLYVVCDGASDGPAGEVAAETAVSAVQAVVEEGQRTKGAFLRALSGDDIATRAVRNAVHAVVRAAEHDESLSGMATTVSVLLVHGRLGTVCHVGDSRVYLLRDGLLHQLTSDHELTAATHLETEDTYAEVAPESFSLGLVPGDIFILCTDGAQEAVEDPTILAPAHLLTPAELATRVLQAARIRCPDRDATAVVVRVREETEPGWLWLSELPRRFGFGHALPERGRC